MAGPYYTTEATADTALVNRANTAASRRDGVLETGGVIFRQYSYTLTGDDYAAGEIIHVAKFNSGTAILSPLCSVSMDADPGTTLTLNIGNYTQASTPVVIDDDKYEEDLVASAGATVFFGVAVANVGAAISVETVPIWLSATIASEAVLSAVTLRFNIAYTTAN